MNSMILFEGKLNLNPQEPNSYIINNISKQQYKKHINNQKLIKILKSKIFKGYQRIKYMQDHPNFDFKQFIKNHPEELYLPSDEKYSIYYDTKYLNKYKETQPDLLKLIKNIKIEKKFKKNKSCTELKERNINKNVLIPKIMIGSNNNSDKYMFLTSVRKTQNNFSRKSITNNEYQLFYLEQKKDPLNNIKNCTIFSKEFKENYRNQEEFLYKISHNNSHTENKKNLYSLINLKNRHKKIYYRNKEEIGKGLSQSNKNLSQDIKIFNLSKMKNNDTDYSKFKDESEGRVTEKKTSEKIIKIPKIYLNYKCKKQNYIIKNRLNSNRSNSAYYNH